MAIVSISVGIVMLFAIPLAWTTMGAIRSGIVFAAISLLCALLAIRDKQKPKLATAALIINIVSVLINGIIGLSFML